MPPATRTRSRRAPDAVCAAAVDLAAAAAAEAGGGMDAVGEHLGVTSEGDRLVAHRFASAAKGYRGWVWSVTLARAPRARHATVDEAVLLPGDDALVAPEWLPWSQRLRPGDVHAADRLPYTADDERLEPGYTATDDADADAVALWELGLGRARVLSPQGRDEAATRWLAERGAGSEEARSASAPCFTCGFWVLLAGSLRQALGVCANEWSPADGRAVAADFGCGAHSETDVTVEGETLPDPVLDETGYDLVER